MTILFNRKGSVRIPPLTIVPPLSCDAEIRGKCVLFRSVRGVPGASGYHARLVRRGYDGLRTHHRAHHGRRHRIRLLGVSADDG